MQKIVCPIVSGCAGVVRTVFNAIATQTAETGAVREECLAHSLFSRGPARDICLCGGCADLYLIGFLGGGIRNSMIISCCDTLFRVMCHLFILPGCIISDYSFVILVSS